MMQQYAWALAVLVILLTSAPRVSGSAFEFSDIECSEEVEVEPYVVGCNGDKTCYMGDTVDIYGKIKLNEDLESTFMCVETNLCFMGLSFLCRNYRRKNVNMCNTLGVSSANDGTACPTAGEFYFSSHVEVPGQGAVGYGKGWFVMVNMEFSNCNKYSDNKIQCRAKFVATSPEDFYYGEEVAAAVLVFAGAVMMFRKRRRTRVAEEAVSSGEEGASNFEMMKDAVVRV